MIQVTNIILITNPIIIFKYSTSVLHIATAQFRNKELIEKYANEQNFNELFCEFENMSTGNLVLQYIIYGI